MWLALRSLARRPAVVVVAVASLAIGIGVNSAVFTVVDAMYLRPPAVEAPEELVEIRGAFKDSRSGSLDWDDSRLIADSCPAFSAVTVSMGRGGLWRSGDERTLLLVDAVGDDYFELLGVTPLLGRLPGSFHDVDADPEPPIVLSHWLWRERMGGRADVIGQRMEFRDHTWRIAAVLPPRFRGLDPVGQRHVFIPVSGWARHFRGDLERGNGQFGVVARLKPGASFQEAQAQLDVLARRIEAADARVARGRRLVATSVARQMRSRLGPGLLVLAVVALVLLVACANVAAVLLAHAEARRREIAMRAALGARPLTLARQFLSESAVLAVAGAGAGLLLAAWLLGLVPALAPPSSIPLNFAFRLDGRALLFTGAAVAVTLVIFGLAPLGYALRVSLVEAMAGGRTAGRGRRSAARSALVTLQVALCVVLVGGALVLTRALGDASAIDPGYDTSRPLALVWANAGGGPLSRPEPVTFGEAADRVAAVGGVEAVTYARHLPLVGSGSGAALSVIPEGAQPDAAPPRVYFNLVGPRFFEVTGARLLSGRPFEEADHRAAAPVAIVNAEAARRFWPGQSALGKSLRIDKDSYEVVGVAADGRIGSLHEAPAPALYLPASRMRWGETILIARTTPDPALVLRQISRAAAQTPGLRVYETSTLRAVVKRALYEDWIPSVLGSGLALLGLLLAAGGLYGAIAYASELRRGEFGVRSAMGARAGEIAALVFRQALRLCAVGVPLGAGLFVVAYRYHAATLLRDRPLDPLTLGAGALITTVAVLAGAVVPALRAARRDPLDVLRGE